MTVNKPSNAWLKHLDFVIVELLLLELSSYVGLCIFCDPANFEEAFRTCAFLMAFCLLVSLLIGHPYQDVLRRGYLKEIRRTFLHTLKMMLVFTVGIYLIDTENVISRKAYFFIWGMFFCLELIARILQKKFIQHKIKQRDGREVMVLCVNSADAERIINKLYVDPLRLFRIVGIFLEDYDEWDKMHEEKSIAGIQVLGSLSDSPDYALRNWVDSVCFASENEGNRELIDNLQNQFEVMGITTHHIIAALAQSKGYGQGPTCYVEKLGTFVVSTYSVRLVSWQMHALKRTMDVVGGFVGCILTLILTIFVGPIIFIKSPGPIFFAQNRIGKNGKVFKMYKFRSMYMDAEKRKAELLEKNKVADGYMFKLDDDPRIIGSEKKDKNGKPKGIGNFIRKTSIDEFPQFFNVLKGDMSLVGTRPPTLDEWNRYNQKHRIRMTMRPGITGLWQISGRSDITDFDKVVELDTDYLDRWTIGMDIKILFRTVKKVFTGEGAE